MARLAGLVLLIVLLAAGVWVWTGGDPARLRGFAPATAPQAAESLALPASGAGQVATAAGAAADAAADAAAIATDAAAEATDAARNAPLPPASEAAQAARIAAENAIRAADAAADAAARADAEAEAGNARGAVEAARDVVAATDSANAAARQSRDAALQAAAVDRQPAPEDFDAARLGAMIDASALAPERKAALKERVALAAANPALVPAVLEEIRAALE